MSETDTEFQIEIDDETTLHRDDLLAHSRHGAMRVDQIAVSPRAKRARLTAEDHPQRMSIELTGDEMREQWGETLAADPFDLSSGDTNYSKEFESEDLGVSVSLEVSGPEENSEIVMCHIHDQTVRVLESLESGEHPSESDGVFEIDWDSILAERGSDESETKEDA